MTSMKTTMKTDRWEVVGGNAGLGRMQARQDRRMAGAGLGQAVGLIAVDRHQSLVRHPAQAAGVAAAILVEQIGAELIHHDGHDQLGRRQGRAGGLRRRRLGGLEAMGSLVHAASSVGQAA